MLLASALALTYLGFASLALRQAPHYAAVSRAAVSRAAVSSAGAPSEGTSNAGSSNASRRSAPPPELSQRLLYRGSAALLLGAALSFWAEGPSFGSLVWVFLLAAAGVAVTFTLTWRPHWLRWVLTR